MKKESHKKAHAHMKKAEHHMGEARKLMSKPAAGLEKDKEKMMAKKGDKKGSKYP